VTELSVSANTTNIGNMTANPMIHAVPKPAGVSGWKYLGGGYSQLFTITPEDQLGPGGTTAWGSSAPAPRPMRPTESSRR
jgi:hypothetical protein